MWPASIGGLFQSLFDWISVHVALPACTPRSTPSENVKTMAQDTMRDFHGAILPWRPLKVKRFVKMTRHDLLRVRRSRRRPRSWLGGCLPLIVDNPPIGQLLKVPLMGQLGVSDDGEPSPVCSSPLHLPSRLILAPALIVIPCIDCVGLNSVVSSFEGAGVGRNPPES